MATHHSCHRSFDSQDVLPEIPWPDAPDTEFSLIPRYNGRYCMSRTGRVWSRLGGGGKILSEWREIRPQISKGYRFVVLSGDGEKRKSHYIHALLLECFVGSRPDGLWGLHGDDVGSHNDLSNLYWGTPQQNAFDRSRNGKVIGESHGMSKLTEEAVIAARMLRKAGMKYQEIRDRIEAEFGISVHTSMISHIVHGRTWRHIKEGEYDDESRRYAGTSGERNGTAILKEEHVRYGRELRKTGMSYPKIVEEVNKRFGIEATYAAVYQAVAGISWKHLE